MSVPLEEIVRQAKARFCTATSHETPTRPGSGSARIARSPCSAPPRSRTRPKRPRRPPPPRAARPSHRRTACNPSRSRPCSTQGLRGTRDTHNPGLANQRRQPRRRSVRSAGSATDRSRREPARERCADRRQRALRRMRSASTSTGLCANRAEPMADAGASAHERLALQVSAYALPLTANASSRSRGRLARSVLLQAWRSGRRASSTTLLLKPGNPGDSC
jgi:hypothetical protein